MSQRRSLFYLLTLIALVLIGGGLLLIGCAPSTPAPTAVAVATDTATAVPETPTEAPTEAPTDTPEPTPTEAPTDTPEPPPTDTPEPEPEPVEISDESCVSCHTDQEQLIATADEEEVPEELSEGEG